MPQVVRVHSAGSDFQQLEVLKRNRNKRHKQNQFFVEGVRNINQALQCGWDFAALVYAEGDTKSEWAREIIRRADAPVHYRLSPALMEQLSDKEDTSEVIAIITMRSDDLSSLPLSGNPLFVVFDRPSNKGNLGTIIRSCDALCCDGLIITGHAVDLYDPETIRSTMGSFFPKHVVRLPSHNELSPWIAGLRERYPSLQVVGTSAHAAVTIQGHDFTQPTILLVGNETDGLSYAYQELSDAMVTISMGGTASSLNVACATSILLYEVSRQRGGFAM